MHILLRKFMNEYRSNTDQLVDSSENYYILLESLTDYIRQGLSENFFVKGSCGQGRKSECPWICIFNKEITTSARNGIYYAILFKSDMSGFYLSLCLGMEHFKEVFRSEWENKLTDVANYFRNRVKSEVFTLSDINLGVDKGTRGHGYEISNIIAKYYELEQNDYELEYDIKVMTDIYDNICESMKFTTYSEVIDNILSYSNVSLLGINAANIEINQALLKESNKEDAELVTLREVSFPEVKEVTPLIEMTRKRVTKKDYVEVSKKQIRNGLFGEQLVIRYESDKMIANNRPDLVNKINWVSEVDDSKGYDIESFDFDENGNEFRIYIEVKTSEKSEKDPFFISINEVETMKKLGDKYWIYRIGKTKGNPVFYKINGLDFEVKIKLKNYTFIAEIN